MSEEEKKEPEKVTDIADLRKKKRQKELQSMDINGLLMENMKAIRKAISVHDEKIKNHRDMIQDLRDEFTDFKKYIKEVIK